MLDFVTQLTVRRLANEIDQARRRGVGVYVQEWCADEVPATNADRVLEWCRETIAGTRRPRGVARFDLALGAASASVGRVNLSLPRLVPMDLYPGDPLLGEVERFLREHGPVRHLVVALFSWGDAAHAVEMAR